MRKFIIHLLGGVTVEEQSNHGRNMYTMGRKSGKTSAAAYIFVYAQSLWGLSKQEWIDKMFAKVEAFLSDEEMNYFKKNMKANDE